MEMVQKNNCSCVDAKLANYNLLASVFIYPVNEGYKEEITNVYNYLNNTFIEAASTLKPFLDFVNQSSVVEIQELFLRSFDVQAITTLDIGFVLFGEDYKRGKLLVHLNEEHNKVGNKCETELSDHLPNLLKLLPKMEDEEMRNEIATLLIIPAVEKMVSEFSLDKIEKKDKVYKKHQKVLLDYSQNNRTIFQTTLMALFMVLQRDFDYYATNNNNTETEANNSQTLNQYEAKEIKDFSENIESEMLTEK